MKKFARGAVAGAAGTTAHPPGGLHREPELTSAKDQQKARALGLTSATGLVIGTVIGAGVFTMPAVLAGAGTISLAVLAVIAVGAMVLAVLFGQLTRRVPNSDGGLYAYARHEFGDFAGYLTGWCYWVQAWAATRPSSRPGCFMWTPCSASIRRAWGTGGSP
jgi:amino acid permease